MAGKRVQRRMLLGVSKHPVFDYLQTKVMMKILSTFRDERNSVSGPNWLL